MPTLDFSVLPDGLLVDAVIGLDGDTIAAQIAAGQPITSLTENQARERLRHTGP